MSYLKPLSDRLDSIILGNTSNSGFGVSVGRFHKMADEVISIENQPLNVLERSFNTILSPGYEVIPVNPLDGFGLFYHDVTVTVGYSLTGFGDPDAESPDEFSAGSSLPPVQNRAATDAHDIKSALEWYENVAGLDPHVINMALNGKPSLSIDKQKGTAVLSIPFLMMVKASVQGNYIA